MTDKNRRMFKHFSETATIHGLYKVGHSKGKLRRAVWGATFLLLVGMALLTITLIFLDFFTNKFYTELERRTQGPMEFPSVTICHANNFRMSAFEGAKTQIKQLLESTRQRSLKLKTIIPGMKSDVFFALTAEFTNISKIKQVSATPHALKWNFDDWCHFSYSSECKYPDDFKDFFYHSLNGFCKTLEFDGKKRQVAPGLPFGLSLKFFINQQDKVPLLSDHGAGVLLMVHPRNVYPNPFAKGILLPTGKEAFISTKKLVFKRLKRPYKSNCTDGKGHFQIYPGSYNVINCQYSCQVRNMMEKCGYIEQAYKYHKPKEFAKSLKLVKQQRSNLSQLTECMNSIISENCDCPAPCDEERFATSISYTQWPNPASVNYYRSLIANFTKHNVTESEVYQSLVSVKVFFDELGYEVISESPANQWPQLFSSIGGQMGLWISASIFSLVEVVMFLLKICFKKINGSGGS